MTIIAFWLLLEQPRVDAVIVASKRVAGEGAREDPTACPATGACAISPSAAGLNLLLLRGSEQW